MTRLRIALLTHSTNPRGGVAHALALGEGLHDRDHDVTVFAPDVTGRGFSRTVRCRTQLVPARPAGGAQEQNASYCSGLLLPLPVWPGEGRGEGLRAASDSTLAFTPTLSREYKGEGTGRGAKTSFALADLVEQRASEYVAYFENRPDAFDVWHAQDGISGNALATLVQRGLIGGYVRTVHHLDDFGEPRLAALQDRSVRSAMAVVTVSDLWARNLRERYGLHSTMIPNGVDRARFAPVTLDEHRRRGAGPVFLSIGGVEARKNSTNLLRAFIAYHATDDSARLVIAGGASLLDHGAYRAGFDAVLAAAGASVRAAVHLIGVVSDDDLPGLIRGADALLFPSIKEGFGLVVLEAMSCGTPTVVSRIAPFTEYLRDECAWCDPDDIRSVTDAMREALTRRDTLRQRGFGVAARFSWPAAAKAHEALYHTLLQESARAPDAFQSPMAG